MTVTSTFRLSSRSAKMISSDRRMWSSSLPGLQRLRIGPCSVERNDGDLLTCYEIEERHLLSFQTALSCRRIVRTCKTVRSTCYLLTRACCATPQNSMAGIYLARLVATGFSQRVGVDTDETFVLVKRLSTFSCLVAGDAKGFRRTLLLRVVGSLSIPVELCFNQSFHHHWP